MTLMTGSAYLNDLPKSPAAADSKKFQILDVKRLVQAPALFRSGDFRGVGFLAEEKQRRVAGRGVDQQKNQQADEQQNRHRAGEAME